MIRSLADILVFSDMDGTLLTDDKQLTSANFETIRLFTMLGGHFSVATGRVVESVARYGKLLPLLSPVVTSGGCVVYDYAKGSVMQNELLPHKTAQTVLWEIGRQFPKLGIVVMGGNQRTYQLQGNEYSEKLFSDEQITYFVNPLEDLPEEWNKVLFAGPADMLERLEYFVSKRNYPGVYFVSTDLHYFEMMPRGVNKGSAMRKVGEMMSIPPHHIFAIGDYYNDIDMLRAAGHAVVVEDAPKEIKMLAHTITGSCNESGVGQFLYTLIQKYGK